MNSERLGLIKDALKSSQLDAFVCALPSNVLMLTGYWPVTGTAIALVTREGAVALVAPEDEMVFARRGGAGSIESFEGGSLDNLDGIVATVERPLREAGKSIGLKARSSIGVELGASFDPSAYAATLVYGSQIEILLKQIFPSAVLHDAMPLLERLKEKLTSNELENLRRACSIAAQAYVATGRGVSPGMTEFEVANHLHSELNRGLVEDRRSGGFAYCMSGTNSAKAYAAYQQSSDRALSRGDFVLLHCNSYWGGMWTDITRTFLTGPADQQNLAIRGAVLEAGKAALDAVRPGIKASAVDHAARLVLESRGFAKEFRHATGHGVGFAAINHNARPRIHPLSTDILESGMVFNIEPAVYIQGYGGLRHCNMVAVSATGAELLTPFQQNEADLILGR